MKLIINVEGKIKYASGIIILKTYMTYVDRWTRFNGGSRNFRTGGAGPTWYDFLGLEIVLMPHLHYTLCFSSESRE